MRYTVIVMLVFLLVLVCRDAFTDIVYLTNGTRREGTVIHQDAKKVVLRIGDEKDGVDVAFSRDEVLRIDKIGETQAIEVPLAQGATIKIAQPHISAEPLFVNQTVPIITGVEQDFDEGNVSSEEETMRAPTPSETALEPLLLHDVESERITEKDAQIRENLKRYLDQTNSTHSNHHP